MSRLGGGVPWDRGVVVFCFVGVVGAGHGPGNACRSVIAVVIRPAHFQRWERLGGPARKFFGGSRGCWQCGRLVVVAGGLLGVLFLSVSLDPGHEVLTTGPSCPACTSATTASSPTSKANWPTANGCPSSGSATAARRPPGASGSTSPAAANTRTRSCRPV